MWSRRAAFIVVAVIVALYDRWAVRAAGEEFHWGRNIDGYYNLLARGFASGHLYLPFQPNPELLKLKDPWDPAVDDSLKLFDAALYNNRYYLYHGAGPAVLLFLPWRIATGHDLPENFASFLFCFGGFVFSGAALLALLRLAGRSPGSIQTAVLLLALAFCTSVPFLMNRTWVYEVAIAGGYCCASAGIWLLIEGASRRSAPWLTAAGIAFGFAAACRPHMALFAIAGLALVALRARSRLLPYLAPLLIAALVIGIYNYQRFGNPAEFGIRYLLTGRNQNRIKLEARNMPPSAYYLLLTPPEPSPLFPWVRLPWPPRDVPRPPQFFLEPSVGAFWLAPFLPALLLVPRLRKAALPTVAIAITGAAIFLFLAATGWSTQRYEVDFLPPLALAALTGSAVLESRWWRFLIGLLIIAGMIVNFAIAIIGPVDEMIQKRPDRYVRLAGMFTPPGPRRLDLNRPFTLTCAPDKLLLRAGTPLYRYELSARDGILTSSHGFSRITGPVTPSPLNVTYNDGNLSVVQAGVEILRHATGPVVTSQFELTTACRP